MSEQVTLRALLSFYLLLCMGLPAQVADDFTAERFQVHVRIGTPSEMRSILTEGRSVFLNARGEIVGSVKAGEHLTIRTVRRVPAPHEQRIWLGDFSPDEKTDARAVAAQATRHYNFHAEVLEIHDERGRIDHLKVVMGHFETEDAASVYLDAVRREHPHTTVWEDLRQRSLAVLEVRNASDEVLGEFTESFSLVPVEPRGLVSARRGSQWRHYHGAMLCTAEPDDDVLLINTVHTEDYIASVVAREIGRDAPIAAMQAQAIVGRSEALNKVDGAHHRRSLYDLCDTTHCQDYRGADWETRESRLAAQTTSGYVLMYGDEICDTIYAHSCGGATAQMQDIWRSDGHPYVTAQLDTIPAVPVPDLSSESAVRRFLRDPPQVMCDPDLADGFPAYATENFRWTCSFTAREMRRCYPENIGPLRRVHVTDRSATGRVRQLSFVGTRGVVTFDLSPEILGGTPRGVRSTLFVIDEEFDAEGMLESVTFTGGGWGHGVGLCQMGAYMRGMRGEDHRAILEAYFPEAERRRVY